MWVKQGFGNAPVGGGGGGGGGGRHKDFTLAKSVLHLANLAFHDRLFSIMPGPDDRLNRKRLEGAPRAGERGGGGGGGVPISGIAGFTSVIGVSRIRLAPYFWSKPRVICRPTN